MEEDENRQLHIENLSNFPLFYSRMLTSDKDSN